MLSDLLDDFAPRFQRALVGKLLWRLGVAPADDAADRTLARAVIAALKTRRVGIDRFFFDWRGGRDGAHAGDAFDSLRAALAGRQRTLSHPYWTDPAPCSMLIDEVEAIWSAIAERDEWDPFEAKIAAIRRMADAMTSDAPA